MDNGHLLSWLYTGEAGCIPGWRTLHDVSQRRHLWFTSRRVAAACNLFHINLKTPLLDWTQHPLCFGFLKIVFLSYIKTYLMILLATVSLHLSPIFNIFRFFPQNSYINFAFKIPYYPLSTQNLIFILIIIWVNPGLFGHIFLTVFFTCCT